MYKKMIGSCFALWTLVGCSAVPLTFSPTPEPDYAVGSSLPMVKKHPVEKISAPARELDVMDQSGGRLTLIEMHRKKIREVEDLKTRLRVKDQQIAASKASNEELLNQFEKLTKEREKETVSHEKLLKENREITTKLLNATFKQAQAERELLTFKIKILGEQADLASMIDGLDSDEGEKEESEEAVEEKPKEMEPKDMDSKEKEKE